MSHPAPNAHLPDDAALEAERRTLDACFLGPYGENDTLLEKLLVVYVVLGVLAMREKRSRTQRAAFYVAALATFLFIYGIARAHHPAGWLLPLLG